VKIFKTSDGGKELIIQLLSEGDFFGYTTLIENAVYNEYAETLEDSQIRVIPKKEFEKLITTNQEIALKVIKLLANNITEKEQQLVALAYHSLRKRVADALLTLKKKYAINEQEQFSISISREDLANIAGTATESLIRTLSDFKNEQLIEIKEGKITLLAEKKLQNLFN
jgi:CRP-like cAMP-binding protein